jgi:acyl-coenzyme A thioesterase PaaI-like protein
MTTAPDTEAEQPDAQRRERTFTWEDPVAIALAGARLSGAEFFTAIAEGTIPPPPVMRALDMDGVSFGEGRAAFRLTPQEFHYNPLGTVHGGVFATLLDSACGCAVHTMLPEGVFYTSLDLSVILASASAVRRPRWTTVPSAVIGPVSTVTGRRNFTDRSRLV